MLTLNAPPFFFYLEEEDPFRIFWRANTELILYYGILLTYLQKAERCIYSTFSEPRKIEDLQDQRIWSTKDYPEFLLFEIENNLLIRPIQFQVAMHIMNLSFFFSFFSFF